MNIAIETSIAKTTNAGIERYAQGLMSGFERMGLRSLDYREYAYKPRFSRRNKVLRSFDTLGREVVWMQWGLGREYAKGGVDLLHVTNPMMPINPGCPVVVTVHDLHPLQHPENSTKWARLSFKYYLELVLQRADSIISVSTYTADELQRLYPNVDPAKMHVVLEGVESRFCPLSSKEVVAIRKKYELNDPFVFSLFNWSGNKNVARLVESFALASERSDLHLVMAGGMNGRMKDAELLASRFGVADRVHFLGYVPEGDLPALYNAAEIFCFPSLYEGFGLPPLEAMACGTPVVASNVTSMPEVLGDAVVLVDPYNCDAIAEGIRSLIGNEFIKNRYIDAGKKRAAELTWEECARHTLSVYSSLVN